VKFPLVLTPPRIRDWEELGQARESVGDVVTEEVEIHE